MNETEPGRLLTGRYRLLSVIGHGGMGVVWRGRDEVLNRDVAVKEILWPHLTDEEQQVASRRAIREAQMAGRLSHQNVVRIYDIVEEDGHPSIVMELLPYRSLRDLVREDGPLPPAQAAHIGLGVLGALRAAHAEGILHRDVKPANILLGPDGRVVLTDFGIARAVDSPTLTNSGALLGSPSYIAPERAMGQKMSGAAGVPGDLWGLGASLYTAVEGHPPFERGSALATLTAVVADTLGQPVLAGPLAPVIEGLLRKDPGERLGADEAEWMLRRVIAEPESEVPAPPPGPAAPPLGARERAAVPAGEGPVWEYSSWSVPSWEEPVLGQPGQEPAAEEPAAGKTALEEPALEMPALEMPALEEAALRPLAQGQPGSGAPARQRSAAGEPPADASPPDAAAPLPAASRAAAAGLLAAGTVAGGTVAGGQARADDARAAGRAVAGEPAGEAAVAEALATGTSATQVPAARASDEETAARPPAAATDELPPAPPRAAEPQPPGSPGRPSPAAAARVSRRPGDPRDPRTGHRPRSSRRLAAALAALALTAAGVTALAFYLTSSPGQPASTPAAGQRPASSHSASPAASSPAATPSARAASAPASGAGSAPSGSAPSGSAPSGSARASSTGSAAGYGALPAGYHRFTNSTGFSIGVPNGWQISHQGHYVYVTDPSDPNIYLLIDQSDHPQPNALADWEQQQASRKGTYPDYHLIRLVSVNYPQAEQAADWEFTYVKNGVLTHILNRNILANASHAYALYWSTPDSNWSADYHYFQAFAATFTPAPA